ncbi:MAG: hypothetical protein H7301_08760 [Cryobacterium sp.]|nr:hypothetical protein [Oligoflexia bacterium]
MKGLLRLAVFLFVGSPFAMAQDQPEWVFGRILVDQYEAVGPGRNQRESETLQSGLTFFGGIDPALSETVTSKLLVRGSAFRRSLENPNSFIFRGDVREAWVDHSEKGFSVRAGEVVTAWGRSDAVNPTDYLTAKDFTFLSSSDDVRRKGAPGVRMSLTPNGGVSPWEITVAWNALYPQSKLLIPTSAIPAGLQVETDPENPRLLGNRQEWAFKLAYLAPSFDLSLSAFDGRTHFGQFIWDGTSVRLAYLPVRALGTDFSVTFDQFVLRGESAYFFYDVGRAGGGSLSLTEPNHWDTVVGIERPLGERFRLIAQLLYRVHPSLRDSQAYTSASPLDTAVVRGVGKANALIQNYQDHSRVGATFLFSYTSSDEIWTGELAAIGNFVGGDYLLRPKLGRKFGERMRLAAGVDYYGGPTDRPLGSLRDYRSANLEGSLTF